MIRVQHISKKFGKQQAVDDVSFHVPEGKTLVLLGTSGSGKTTTLRMINRLIEPDKGEIWINGEAIAAHDAATLRRTMGYVLQSYGLFPHYTVAENIAVVPRLLGWSPVTIKNRVTELLTKLKLNPEAYYNAYPAALSGGQKQRIGLARALASYPPILLMDEPFGALDPITRSSIRKEFKELDEFRKKTIILVTHDVLEAFELGDIICIMDQGKVIQCGSPKELLFNPANEFVQHFLNAQRLQLELKSMLLEDIVHLLPVAGQAHIPLLPGTYTLWQVLETITTSGQEHYARYAGDDTVRSIHPGTVYQALTSLKVKN